MMPLITHPARGYLRGKWAQRPRPATHLVVHSTGGGPWRRLTEPRFDRWRERHGLEAATAFQVALAIYGYVMDAGPHWVIGQAGELEQVAPTDLAAWHVGSSGRWQYKWWHVHHPATYDWWCKRHPLLPSPLKMSAWKGGSVNANTEGLEVVPPRDPSAPWSKACLEAIGDLIERRRLVPTTHADVHPLSRVKRGVPWDPAPAPLAQLDGLFRELSRA